MIVFDSSAWLEYFSGSLKGKTIKEIIESQEEILTPSICIAEIKRKYLKEEKEHKSRIKFVTDRSKIIKIDLNISSIAADIAYNNKLYMIDALVYACAIFAKANFLTGDHHFKGLRGVNLIE